MRSKIALAALAATAAFASPAMAQTVSSDDAIARGIVLLPLTLVHDDTQPLDFGTVLASPLAGTVTINADDGSRTVSGGVTAIALDVGGRAIFNGAGTEGQLVDLTLTPPASLAGPGPAIVVLDMDLDSGGGFTQTRTIPVGGAFQVGVGGEFAIAANQTNGVYSATFTVEAAYQ
jgi:hypothetical protein